MWVNKKEYQELKDKCERLENKKKSANEDDGETSFLAIYCPKNILYMPDCENGIYVRINHLGNSYLEKQLIHNAKEGYVVIVGFTYSRDEILWSNTLDKIVSIEFLTLEENFERQLKTDTSNLPFSTLEEYKGYLSNPLPLDEYKQSLLHSRYALTGLSGSLYALLKDKMSNDLLDYIEAVVVEFEHDRAIELILEKYRGM